jgi:3-deoxy-manno-octulosonate cytidylyltransferase (CMP-KDO synthetase)
VSSKRGLSSKTSFIVDSVAAAVPEEVRARAQRVKLVAFDVDGVLCSPLLEYGTSGEEVKRFHVRDGMGIRLLLESGIEVAVVSARTSGALVRRLRDLGIVHASLECLDKLSAIRALVARLGLELSEVCFAGDDLFDVPVLHEVGFPVCVADAHPIAKREAAWVTASNGGEGAVREIADLLLGARRELDQVYSTHLARELARNDARRAEDDSSHESGFGVIIPARYASSRLPGKPLREIAGVPMVARVYQNARASGADYVIVATDDERIVDVVERAGGRAVLTSPHHSTGTDRLAEVVAVKSLPPDAIVVNVQGDEPLLDPAAIRRVARSLRENPRAGIATLAIPIRDAEALFDPNVVKVVLGENGQALYFSRAPIPWDRDRLPSSGWPTGHPLLTADESPYLRHIGLYAYRVQTLQRLANERPTRIERLESLEQLRALWLGITIQVEIETEAPAHGVDTEEDLERVEELLRLGAAKRKPVLEPV